MQHIQSRKIKTYVYVAKMSWGADTPAASAASDLRVQFVGLLGLVNRKNIDERRCLDPQNGLLEYHCLH